MRTPNNKAANHAVNFFNNLTLTGDYSHTPWKLRKWQEQIIKRIFGTLDRSRKRKIKKVMLLLGRKNGKSQLAAGLALYCLFCFPPGQQIISAGASREQAARIFDMAAQMVRADPFLSSLCTIVSSQKRIVIEDKHSFYVALSSDAHTAHGYNPSVVIADELHCWKHRDLWDALTTGFGARKEPLTIAITTQPADRHSFCWEEVEYAKQVEQGVIENESYLPILFYSDLEDDWSDEKLWKQVNPAAGDFLEMDFLRQEFEIAKELPSRENVFRQLYLNQPVEQSTKWLSLDKWDQCTGNVDTNALIGAECWGGLDLAPVRDLSALCLLFKVEDKFHVLPYIWCCEDDIRARSRRDKVPYEQWSKQGFLRTTPGSSTDFDIIRRDINELANKYRIKVIAADQAHAYQLGQQLVGDGIDVQWYRQGFMSMSPPSQRLEKLIIDKQLLHGGHPVLRWCSNNVSVETDAAGNVKPSKKKSTERIDAIVALVQAIGVSMVYEQDSGSVYEEEGAEWV